MLDANAEEMADFATLAAPEKADVARKIGRIGALIVDSIEDASRVLVPVARAFANAARSGTSLAAVVGHYARDESIAEMLFGPAIKAAIAAHLMVRREAGVPVVKVEMKQVVGSVLDMPWPEAVEDFLERGLVRESEFAPILRRYMADSEEGRALLLNRLRERTEQMLAAAIDEGTTQAEFAADFAAFTDGLGISRANPAYLETVFRTNIQSAYGEQREKAILDPDVVAARPYVELLVVDDARTSDICRPLSGLIFETLNPAWRSARGPNHFNCRTSTATRSAADVKGRTISAELPAGWRPQEGFA